MARFAALFDGAPPAPRGGDPDGVPEIREDMEQAMVASFGLFRRQETMEAGLADMERLIERYKRVRVRDAGLIFNSELIRALELGFMLDVAHSCALASLHRQESRGSHYRFDYPHLDNPHFLKHSLVERGPDGKLALSYRDVTIVDTQPLDEIKY